MSNQTWKLSPSDFAFLWEECKRCFYLKVVSGFSRPSTPMAKIFKIIDAQMNMYFAGKRTTEIAATLPDGVVDHGEKWVESTPITVPNHCSSARLRGKLDTLIKFSNGTYGVVDFKTSERNAAHIPLYGRQLHAYAYGLEHAATGKLALGPISKLGLLVFEPNAFSNIPATGASLSGRLTWIEIPRDDQAFVSFLSEVLDVLEQPNPPGGSPSCAWCTYRDTSRRTGL
jgi:PD-(D/E)XK nuclease superfamily protein